MNDRATFTRNDQGICACTGEFIALHDNPAFDPQRETQPILRRVFAQPRNTTCKAALQEPAAAA